MNPADTYLATLSPSTRRVMASDLRLASALAPSLPPVHACSPSDLTALRAAIAAKYAPGTANRMLSALRGVIRAAWRTGALSFDAQLRLLASLPAVRGGRVTRGRGLSWEELQRLLAHAGGHEERALLALMAGAGLRRAEVGPALTWDRLQRKHEAGGWRLRVLGKGNKERLLRIPAWTAEALNDWRPAADRISGKRIFRWTSGSSVRNVVAAAAERAGLGHVAPHDLRRTFFGLCRRAGLDLATIRRSMGHASILTTVKYDKRTEEETQDEMAALDDPGQLDTRKRGGYEREGS